MSSIDITLDIDERILDEARRALAADNAEIEDVLREVLHSLAADKARGESAQSQVAGTMMRAADFHKRPMTWREKLYR